MNIFLIIVEWAIPFFLTAVCGLIAKYIKSVKSYLQSVKTEIKENQEKNDKVNEAMKNATVSMLRSQIVSKAEKYLHQGYLPDYARQCIDDLFNQYTALGGNHGVHLLVEKVLNLPIESEEK